MDMRDRFLESVPTVSDVAGAAASPTRAVVLATISFTLLFAAWGLIGQAAPRHCSRRRRQTVRGGA